MVDDSSGHDAPTRREYMKYGGAVGGGGLLAGCAGQSDSRSRLRRSLRMLLDRYGPVDGWPTNYEDQLAGMCYMTTRGGIHADAADLRAHLEEHYLR